MILQKNRSINKRTPFVNESYNFEPKNGFARIRGGDCGKEFLLHFSCHGRGFCPSCHAKRIEEWGDLSACGHAQAEWMREKLLLDVPHRQVVFTIPKMLRIYFKYNRPLLGGLCL
ncbi:MAG: transposase zinc-binding domain-containing protein, partial [Candidatus Aminicenantes bacterium]|nr:transposase zinc-binding domain-containing protein [Candidatus Aminicenantes bacterium]